MRVLRMVVGALVGASAVIGTLALVQPASAAPPDFCPRPFLTECEPCLANVDPIVCTVICAGGPRQMTFPSECLRSCSGYIFKGECTKIGG